MKPWTIYTSHCSIKKKKKTF